MIGLVCIAVFLIALVALIKPVPWLLMPTRRRALAVIAASMVLFIGWTATLPDPDKPNAATGAVASADTPAPAAPPPTVAAPEPVAEVPMPPAQARFMTAIEIARSRFRSAANEMAQGGVRATRRRDLCAALSGLTVTGWHATVQALSSNSEGKGVLAVRLAPKITLTTWNNALSDLADKTLIEPGTALFASASALRTGDRVLVSGQFVASDIDCVKEQSLSLRGSIAEPEFTFRFTSITPR